MKKVVARKKGMRQGKFLGTLIGFPGLEEGGITSPWGGG